MVLTKKQIANLSRLFVAGVILFSGFLATPSIAAENHFDKCRQFFADNTPPVVKNQDGLKLRAICFNSFAVLHSGKSRTPLYVAERLNRAILEKDIERDDNFYEESRLPSVERASLDDYRGSGFDRGHMAPAADMGSEEAMAQSFSLANIVPQAPINNRKAWSKIEKDTRKYVMRATGDVYVITGPVFGGRPQMIGENQVWVPRYLYKLVYDPSSNRAWAHWIENDDEARPSKPISYEELVDRTGIEFLPGFRR